MTPSSQGLEPATFPERFIAVERALADSVPAPNATSWDLNGSDVSIEEDGALELTTGANAVEQDTAFFATPITFAGTMTVSFDVTTSDASMYHGGFTLSLIDGSDHEPTDNSGGSGGSLGWMRTGVGIAFTDEGFAPYCNPYGELVGLLDPEWGCAVNLAYIIVANAPTYAGYTRHVVVSYINDGSSQSVKVWIDGTLYVDNPVTGYTALNG